MWALKLVTKTMQFRGWFCLAAVIFHEVAATGWGSWPSSLCVHQGGYRGGSASIQILHMYITSSCDIRYDNRSYAVVVQRKSGARRQISAPSVPSCVHANNLSFKIYVFWVVKSPHNCGDHCYCSRWDVRTLQKPGPASRLWNWWDSSTHTAWTQGAIKTGLAPD